MAPVRLAVVMPYFRNEKTLWRCLSALCANRCAALTEIIVVDDGGPTRARDVVGARKLDVPVRILETRNIGQSGATNVGLAAVDADIVFLTCADIIARPNLLDAHLENHLSWRESIVVCGHIAYAPWLRMTPFMRYLEEPNVQFDFTHAQNPDSVGPGMFYAPNVSARLADVRQVGMFDEQLVYGFQDVDLGIKLAQLGIRITYVAKARVLHDHPNTPDQFFARQRRVGHMLPRFLRNHPNNAMGLRLVEARACAMATHFDAFRADLFYFYHVVMTLGFVKGALETGEDLRELLDVSPERWDLGVAQLQDFDVHRATASAQDRSPSTTSYLAATP